MKFIKTRVTKSGGWIEIEGDPFGVARFFLNDENRKVSPKYQEAVAAMLAAPDLIEALHVIRSQSIGPDWTADQALAFIKDHAGDAILKAKNYTHLDVVKVAEGAEHA